MYDRKIATKENLLFTSRASIIDSDRLWLLTLYCNVLVEIDWRQKKVIACYPIPEKIFPQNAHLQMVKKNNVIYIIPYHGSHMYAFYTESKEFQEISLKLDNKEKNIKYKFNSNFIAEYNDTLCFLGKQIKGIFFYDIKNRVLKKEEYFLEHICGLDYNDDLFGKCYCQIKEKIYIPMYKKNFVFKIDLVKRSVELLEVKSDIKLQLCTITYASEKFILTTVNDEMIIWTEKNGVEKYQNLKRISTKRKEYFKVFYLNEKMIYFPLCQRRIYIQESADKEEELEIKEGKIKQFNGDYTQFETMFIQQDNIYFQLREDANIYELNTKNNEIRLVKIDICENLQSMLYKRLVAYINGIELKENNLYTLKNFLNGMIEVAH